MNGDRNSINRRRGRNVAELRTGTRGSNVPEALRWRAALAVTLIVLCGLIGLLIGVCAS